MSISEDAIDSHRGQRVSQQPEAVNEFMEVQRAAYEELKRVPLLKPTYFEIGMGYEHNMPCAVYSATDGAVLDCNTGKFHPSWRAQREGWRLVRARSRFQRWLLAKFFNSEVF